MKTLTTALCAFALTVTIIACDDDNESKISADKLPANAKTFIDTHFSGQTIDRVVRDTDGSTEYDVWLANQVKLEFNKSGDWREVDGRGNALPESLIAELPENLNLYLEENYPTESITNLDVSKSRFEVKLSSRVELIFDLSGNFIRFDD